MAHAAQMSMTQRILDRMTSGCLLPLPNDNSTKRTASIFQDAVLQGSLDWQSWFAFRNNTPYRAQVEDGPVIAPWSNNTICVKSYEPEVKFLETQFSEGTVPLTEFEELLPQGKEILRSGKGRQVPCRNRIDSSPELPVQEVCRKTFALTIDFSKFTYGNLQWNRKGELELRLRCEQRRGFEFVNDLAEPDRIEDSIIRMALKNGIEECSYRRILKDPKEIVKVTTQVGDGDEVKRIVLLAEES